MKKAMRVGDLVKGKDGRCLLFCGSGRYPHAVVMSLSPFIMVSEETDMLWTCQTKSEFEVCGKAPLVTQIACLRRLTWKEKLRFFGTKITQIKKGRG